MTFLKKIKPKAYLFENVKNLQSHNKGDTLKIIKKEIHKAKYSYIVRTINTMTHANIPQNRERVFIIGFKGESFFNNEEQGKGKPKRKKKPLMTELFLRNEPGPITLTSCIQDFLEKEPVNEKYYCNIYDFHKKMKSVATRKDTVYQWRRHYTRENKNNVCPTLTANMGTGGHNVPIILDMKDLRKLTPQECARFQGFSEEELKFPNGMANSHLYKQLGNSVTVKVVERLAQAIISSLKQ
jgi:DNA (cytosine-5)-methyltransferase 1